MVSYVRSSGINGIKGFEVVCECDLSNGLPMFDVVGLPDTSVRESRERVRAAIRNCGFDFPLKRITVNLAPADRRKEGPIYDLPIMLSILLASGQINAVPQKAVFVGELSLDGRLRPVNGVLPMALHALERGTGSVFVPAENAREAAFAGGISVYGASHVNEVLDHLCGRNPIELTGQPSVDDANMAQLSNFSEVRGQQHVKRAMEIAAAGGHNIILSGPPGSGKSMLANRLPSILPDMTMAECVESTNIYSVAGLTGRERPIINVRPFRAPHHSVSANALSGGGTRPKPGEISLAHNGVLFLDELPEFRRDALETLRQPLEEGRVTISRVYGRITMPSRFILCAAMNPCKCGWYGQPGDRCTCAPNAVRQYLARISGPLLDRIDLHVDVPAVGYDELTGSEPSESSADIRARVNTARERQRVRTGETGVVNAYLTHSQIIEYCELGEAENALMKNAFERFRMTARSHDKVLKVARTIADLTGAERIEVSHIAEALQYRGLDRMLTEE